MQKKKNNETNDTARDDELSMYAPQEDKIEDAYAAETKIYRIRRHGHPRGMNGISNSIMSIP